MSNFMRVIKINLYSLMAIPFLMIAMAAKLIAKAFGKLGLILTMSIVTAVVVLVIFFINDPGLIKENLGISFVVITVLGAVLSILRLMFGIIRFIMNMIYNAVLALFETIYNLTYSTYVSLYNGCTNDFAYLTLTSKVPLVFSILCPSYIILRLINILVITFINISLVAFIGLSIFSAGSLYFTVKNNVESAFGLSLMDYLNRFDTFSLVQSVILAILLISDVFVVLVSLGLEWKEWAKELAFDNDEYEDYLEHLEDQDGYIEDIEVDTDEDYEYILSVNNHLEEIEAFIEEARNAMELADNPLLENACSEYIRDLSDITDDITSSGGYIKSSNLDRIKPIIRRLDKQKKRIKKLIDKQNEVLDHPTRNSIFFTGCNTREKLDKRYKSLCKTYHPDSENGDEETFKVLTMEYSRLKEML